MLWLEMSRDPIHGGGSWEFTRSLWSPHRKLSKSSNGGVSWAFWDSVLKVRAGDSVLHLRGKNKKAAFVGFSTAETDGFVTTERPPNPGVWGLADSFHRVLLKDFSPFPKPFLLRDIFTHRNYALREYFSRNKARRAEKKQLLFYVIQSGRLQCLNGAYLSEVDDELANLLLGSDFTSGTDAARAPSIDVQTGERIQELRVREGQQVFSEEVRANYGNRCCFPDCSISERQFLIGAHIARWADAPHLRGNIANGLCLCLMHDKAFEWGLFTITADYKVAVNRENKTVKNSRWCEENVLPYEGQPIRCGAVTPVAEALALHWERIGFTPK